MSPDEIDLYPGRDHLISFLGLAAIPEIDRNVRPLSLQPGDWLLLCSDGVDGTLTLDDLSQRLAGDPQTAAEDIIALVQAQNRRQQDNATVAILALVDPTAGLATSASDPPTRRRYAGLPPRPANHKAKSAILISVGLILASLLGIGGWYYLQGPTRQGLSQQGPSEMPTSSVAARAGQPLKLPPPAESEAVPEQQEADGQEPSPAAPVPAAAHVPVAGEVAEPAVPAEPPEPANASPEAQPPAASAPRVP
jgi:hypothetical protein